MRVVLYVVSGICLVFAAFAVIFAAVAGADGGPTFPNLLLHGPFLSAVVYAALCGAAARVLRLLERLK